MPTLPYDILCDVLVRAPPSSYLALCLTNRDCHASIAPLLYREISFEWSQDEPTRTFLDSVLGNEHLGRYVKSLRLRVTDITAPLVCSALRAMPRIEHLNFVSLDVALDYDPIGFVDAVVGLKHLHSIHLWWLVNFDINVLLDRLPPMRRIYLDSDGHHMPSLEQLILRSIDTLECLGVQDYDLDAFLATAPDRVWTRMQDLDVCNLFSASSASAFVNLRRLVVTVNGIEPASLLWDQKFFPRLDQLSFPAQRPASTPANRDMCRAISHVHVIFAPVDHYTVDDFLATMRSFEWRCLQSLYVHVQEAWGERTTIVRLREALPVILEECVSLVFFGVACDWTTSDSADSVDPIGSMLSLSPGVKLPRLRFLSFMTRDNWEEGWGPDNSATARFAPLVEHRLTSIFARFAGLRVAEVGTGPTLTWSRNRPTGDFHLIRALHDEPELPADLPGIAALVDSQPSD